MTERRTAAMMLVFVAVVSSAVYWTTLCRTVYWGDGIELTAVSTILGVAHPTGYPLFSLLGKIFSQIPLGTIAFRLNLMSAVTGSVLAVLVAAIVWRLLPMVGITDRGRVVVRACFGAATGLTAAFSQTIWYHAGLTEVYLLNAAVFVGVLLLVLHVLEARAVRPFLAAVFLCVAGAGNHTTAAVVQIPALGIVGVWLLIPPSVSADRRKRRSPPRRKPWTAIALPALALGVVGVSSYVCMPIRAARNPRLNWGDPSTAGRFLWSVRGGEFRTFYFFKAPGWMFPAVLQGTPFDSETYPMFFRYRIGQWVAWTGSQLTGLRAESKPPRIVPGSPAGPVGGGEATRVLAGLVLLGAALAGWLLLWKRSRILGLFLAVAFVLNLSLVLIYSIFDIEGYLFPAHVFAVICLFVLLAFLHRFAEDRLLDKPSALLAAFLLGLPTVAFFLNRSLCDHSGYVTAETYGRQVFEKLAPDAMILTFGDYDIEPFWYQQIVERRRPDVVIFGLNFLATPGYAKYFEGRHEPPIAAKYFEETPQAEAFFEVVNNYLIAGNIRRRPIYSTDRKPWMKVEAEPIEIPALTDLGALDVPERLFFPDPRIFRITQTKVKP